VKPVKHTGNFQSKISTSQRLISAMRYRHGVKRRMDILLTAALAPLLLPAIGILWFLVRLDGNPGFFGHWRVGQKGRSFKCWKLRSMVPDAEARLREFLATNPAAAREWSANFKLANDPRVTRLGRFLRRTSLDELPQFWNVIRGEMSLVGPRPVPREELRKYSGSEWAYFAFLPGITGLWQISGRNRISYDDRVRMDVSYLLKAGFWFDLNVLFRTVSVVLKKTGV